MVLLQNIVFSQSLEFQPDSLSLLVPNLYESYALNKIMILPLMQEIEFMINKDRLFAAFFKIVF